jgi:methylmalonyl-CoA mutase
MQAMKGWPAGPESQKLLDMWPDTLEAYSGDEYVVKIRDKEIRTQLVSAESLVRHQDPQGHPAQVWR